MAYVRYRLPDWLGGHEVEVIVPDLASPAHWVLVEAPDGQLSLPREQLVEVRPPSIDDPVAWPVEIEDHDGDLLIVSPAYGDPQSCAAAVAIRPDDEGNAIVHLTAAEARLVARALWQRADAIEAW